MVSHAGLWLSQRYSINYIPTWCSKLRLSTSAEVTRYWSSATVQNVLSSPTSSRCPSSRTGDTGLVMLIATTSGKEAVARFTECISPNRTLDRVETDRALVTASHIFRVYLEVKPRLFQTSNCSPSGASVRLTFALKSRPWSAAMISSRNECHGCSSSAEILSGEIDGFAAPPMKRSGGRGRASRSLALSMLVDEMRKLWSMKTDGIIMEDKQQDRMQALE